MHTFLTVNQNMTFVMAEYGLHLLYWISLHCSNDPKVVLVGLNVMAYIAHVN